MLPSFSLINNSLKAKQNDCPDNAELTITTGRKIAFIKFYRNYLALREKCPYAELFWSIFSRIGTEYGEILRISTHSVQTPENTKQNNSEYRHFIHSIGDGTLLPQPKK